MEKFLKNKFILILFLAVFIFYTFFAFQTGQFSSDVAYFHLREIEHIHHFGSPLVEDDLYFGGREIFYPPVFHYLLALFVIFLPIEIALKILPAILIGLLTVISYLLAYRITKDEISSFLAAILTGFIPLLVSQTLNQISVYSLVLPVVFYMLYCFMRLNEGKKYVLQFVVLSFILPLIHPSAFILTLILVFYALLSFTESLSIDRVGKEAIVFSSLLVLLIEFLFYKNALLNYGFGILRGGIPAEIAPAFFSNINVFLVLYHLGVLTLVMGSFGVFYSLFRRRNRDTFLLVSVVLSTFLLLLFRLLDFFGGLLFLGVSLGILSSITFCKFFNYISITKFSKYKLYFFSAVLIFVLALSFVPSIIIAGKVVDNTISEEEVAILEWVNVYSPEGVVVLADVDEGHYVTAIAEKDVILDSYFLSSLDNVKRLEDVRVMYVTGSEARALSLFKEYKVRYIYLSERTRQKYGIDDLAYASNKKCFEKLKENGKAVLYGVIC